ncbi:MAG: radical SAM protein [Bacteriovoracaceae bacterium]|nr:radical SAM protein [Bacteriovoracaceae bacterium]
MNSVKSIYWHYPFCKHLCNYCDFYKLQKKADSHTSGLHESYDQQWQKNLELLERFDLSLAPLETLYFGGGTPSLWGSDGANYLKNFFKKNKVQFAKNHEFALELDPGTWQVEELKPWLDLGLNRISMGVQSLSDEYLATLDRKQSRAECLETLKYFSQQKMNFSADFLLGSPELKGSKRNVIEELKKLLEFSPSHISLYILTVNKKYALYSSLPDDQFIHDEYLAVSEFLRSQGFEHYEVSNFAKPGFHSRHNFVYWQARSFLAMGPSATGYLALESEKAFRYKWTPGRNEFSEEQLGKAELDLEALYLGLRTNLGIQPNQKNRALLESWVNQGYGKWDSETFKMLPKGWIILDSLISVII